MNSPKISVIVPIYKVEDYLQECIDSILAQTFTDFELILVNDGSPDNCGAICDANAARDSRIRVIHQENQGVTRARANGVTAARGEFVNFVDGDDTLPPHSLATLATHANEETDVVLGKREDMPFPPHGELTHDKYREYVVTAILLDGGPVAKLFRRSLFTEDVFNTPTDIRYGEDHIMNIHLAYKVQKRIYNTAAVVYNYRYNLESATHTHRTPESIIAYQTHRLMVIPPDDIHRFLPLGLATSLINGWTSATQNRILIPRAARPHHRYLLSIRKYSDIKFGFTSRLLFSSTNPLIRAIAIYLRKALSIVKLRRS